MSKLTEFFGSPWLDLTKSEMKMAATSLPEDDDDSWVEAEIEKELKNLTIDLDDTDADWETDHDITTDGENLQKEFSDVVMPALDEYISKVNRQVEMMETELRECDDVLHEAEIVTARQPRNDAFLEALAAEAGTDVHSLKQRILLELEAEEKAEKNWNDVTDGSSDDVENDVIVTLPTNQSLSALQVEASAAVLKNSGPAEENGAPVSRELPDDSAKVLHDSISFVPAAASETEAFNCEALEKQLRLQLKEFDRTQQHKEVERQQIEELLKEKENLLLKELAEERQKRLMKIEEEVSQLNEENQRREAKYVKEKEIMAKRMEKSFNESKLQIERLTDRVKEQREALKQMTEEKNSQEEQLRTTSAIKIQARFRGFRVRKMYGVKVKEKIEEVKELRKNDRLKVIEERMRMEEEKKREEERKKMEEEERKRRLEEEEKRRIEEEKQRKEEQVKRKREEERLRKEEERRAKDEAKQRKKEEERKRKELEKLKKEEEKRKKEEEKRKKEEVERKRKEEEERLKREEQERLSKEAEEERKRKEEERKQDEEKQKKHRENLNKSEIEDERLEQIDMAKTNGIRETDSEQKKLETAGTTKIEKNSKYEPTKVVEEDLKLTTSQKIDSSMEESKSKPIEQTPDINVGLASGGSNATEPLLKTSEGTDIEKQPLKVEQNRRLKEQNKTTCEVHENVSKSVEARRMAWMKENQSWSKSVSRQRSQKVVQSQNSLRVPSSAKNLPALDEKVILLSSRAARLNQVVAIELHDISACSLRTLSQCVHLKYLVMNNCSLVATEGLERVTSLQYVDLKNNKLEMMNFNDLVNLLFLDVSMNSLRSMNGLSGCKSLRYLNVSNNRITRISGLESLDRLHTLIASGNQMISTKGLADVISVQVLDLSNNHLSIVDDLQHLGMLRVLDLRSNNLMMVPSLTNQVLLCDLLLDKNSLSSLTTLSKSWLPCLSYLGLSENRLTCLVDFRFCLCLQSLDISNNLITDISSISTELVSCQRLESMNVTGNAVVEDANYRNILLSTIKSLRYLNEEKQMTDSASVPSMEPDSWLATCLSHVDGYRHLHGDYAKSLEIADNDGLSNIYDTHERYFTSSHQMATHHRFFHEYGGKMLPQPPVTPKLSAHEESNFVSFEKPPSIQESSLAQTMDMKAKFEQALLGTSSSKNTQSKKNGGSDQKELKNNMETVDKRFSSEGDDDKKSPVSEKTALLKKEFNGSLAAKNLGFRRTSPAASSDVSRSSPEADGGYGGGGNISQLPQQPMNGSSKQAPTAKTSKEIDKDCNQSKLYSGNVGYLDRAAAKIQSLWRGYSFRKRFQNILNDAHLTDDVTGDLDFDDFNIEALMPNDLCFDKDLVLPPTPRNPIENSYTGDHVPVYCPSANPDMDFPPFPKQAWRSNNTPSPLGELIPPRGLRPYPPGKPPLPPSSRLSNLTDAHSNTTAGHSLRQEKIMEEWDFKNPRTAELFLQRAKNMDQLSRKKRLTDLATDPIRRLAIMRRLEETNKVPLSTASLRRERPQPRKEYFKALREQEELRDSEVERERHQKAEYTFEWLHAQVEHCDSPFSLKRISSEGSLPQINPGSLGGKIAAFPCSPSSHELQSAGGASAANVSIKQRRLSFNSDKLPPLSVNSKPSSAGLTHEMTWHRSEVHQSVGWGGGKKRAHQRR